MVSSQSEHYLIDVDLIGVRDSEMYSGLCSVTVSQDLNVHTHFIYYTLIAISLCSNHSSESSALSLQELHSSAHTHQLEILHTSSSSDHTTIELVTEVSSALELETLGLTHCTQLAHMDTLIASELAGNWDNLRHHIELDTDQESTLPDTVRDVILEGRDGVYDRGLGGHTVLRRSVSTVGDDDKMAYEDKKEVEEWFTHYVSRLQ